MKSSTIILGVGILGLGVFIGWQGCKKTITMIINDKEYMSKHILPSLEEKIGKDKLERMTEIYYEGSDK